MTRNTRLFLSALGVIIAAIVIFDVLRSPATAPTAPPALDAPLAPEIRRGLNKRPLLYPVEFTADLAGRVAGAFLAVEEQWPGGSQTLRGIAIGEHQALVAPFRLSRSWRVSAGQDGQARQVTHVAADAVHGVAMLTVDGPPLVPLSLANASTDLSEPVVSIGVGRDVRVPFPTILDPPLTYNRLEAVLAGRLEPGEISVDLEGSLLAFGAASPDRIKVLTAPELAPIVSALRSTGRHRHPWTGVQLQAIGAALRPRFPKGSLVVVHVDPESSAPRQLAPGTVLSQVLIGSAVATTEEQVSQAMYSAPLATYVRTDGRTFDVPVIDRQLPEMFAPDGPGATVAERLPRLTVAPMSRAAANGLRTGDVIVAIDLRPVRFSAQIEAAMRGRRDCLLTVRRGETRRFVLWTASGPEQAP